MLRTTVLFLTFCFATIASTAGQAVPFAASSGGALELPPEFAGAPPPVLPDTIARDDSGRVTVRAIRLTSPLRLDGQLDEAVYQQIRPASDFVQTDPEEGVPATEKTDVWVLYDDDNVYVSARMWESHPERLILSDMRKDGPNVYQGSDTFSFIFDTFYDRRNAVGFIINPIGGRQDGQITNERWNRDWNTIWDFGLGRFDGGWTVEVAIPFKSLRYRPGASQIWGFNGRRMNRWKNEVSHLTAIPNAQSGNGLFRSSLAAALVGLEVPPGSRNLEIKPYAISSATTDRLATPPMSNHLNGDLGLDVKYGVTQNLTADFTYNTDFAQVEADEQQVNLTRFSLFFPEKREFFLENPGLFTFGGTTTNNNGNYQGDAPILFYSRRVGLNQGRIVPIEAGGRLTGRIGRYSLGVANIQTGDEATSGSRATNFSVVRLRRDVLRKSSIGLIATGRSVTVNRTGSNEAFGVDGLFSFFDNLNVNTYWARTHTDGLSGDDTSYRAALEYGGDRYGVELERLTIGDNFNPEVGFLRRDDMRKTYGQLRFSPRPRSSKRVRKFAWTGQMAYFENGSGRLETRASELEFEIEFQNSDRFRLAYVEGYEFLARPFEIAPEIAVPVGGYGSDWARLNYYFGQQRATSAYLTAEYGTFYSGHRTTLGYNFSRVKVSPQLTLEPTYTVNWIDLVEGSFTTHLAGSRVTYTMTPLMFASALLQYSSTNHTMAANVRLRWEYRPGSELFVVYNEERDSLTPRFPDLSNRAFIVKINRLLRF